MSRVWYAKIYGYLLQQGFQRSQNEHTLYKKLGKDDNTLIVCIYIDDIVYMSSSHAMIEEFKEDMKKTFEMTNLGVLNYFLGVEVKQNEEGIFVSQKKYTVDILNPFKMQHCKMAPTPMNLNEKLQMNDGTGEVDVKSYRSLIGRLLYLTHARLDISFAVGMLSRFMNAPTKHHLGVGK